MADHYVDVVNEKDEVMGRELKSRRLEGFISRVVVIMIMDSEGRVIVGKRAPHKRFDADQYDLVCGNVNSGEDYHQAAARELKEELGLECPLVMLDKYYLENVHDGKKVRIFCAAFLGRSDEEPLLNHELASFRKMSLEEIGSGMAERPQEFTQGFRKEFGRLKSKLPRIDSIKPGKDFIGVGCGAIVINGKDEVLLIKRSSNLQMEPGTWSRPGGRVEYGEKVEDAVRRELKEETGIDVEVVRFLEITQTIEDGKHWISLGFLARHVSGTPTNVEPSKHDEMMWFPLSRLPENLNSYTRNAINVYLESRKFKPGYFL